MQLKSDFHSVMGTDFTTSTSSMIHEPPTYLNCRSTPEEFGNELGGPWRSLDSLTVLGSPLVWPLIYTSKPSSMVYPLNTITEQTAFPEIGPILPKLIGGNPSTPNRNLRGQLPKSSPFSSRSFSSRDISALTPLSSSSFLEEPLRSWTYLDEGCDSIFPRDPVGSFDARSLEMETDSLPCPDSWNLWGPSSPSCHTIRGKAVNKIRHSFVESPQSPGIPPNTVSVSKDSDIQLKLVHETKFKCHYFGCHKMFQRREHLKRHRQTFHGEGPNRFACEFCGRDQFNRRDNLNNHRKLHARPSNGNRAVKFIPAAIPIIEHEERNRKKRKARTIKAANDY